MLLTVLVPVCSVFAVPAAPDLGMKGVYKRESKKGKIRFEVNINHGGQVNDFTALPLGSIPVLSLCSMIL